jgi:hypothetical protein
LPRARPSHILDMFTTTSIMHPCPHTRSSRTYIRPLTYCPKSMTRRACGIIFLYYQPPSFTSLFCWHCASYSTPPLSNTIVIVFHSHPCHSLLPADDFSKSGKSTYIPIDHDFRENVKQTIITLSPIERFIYRGRSPIYRRNNLADKPTQRRYNLDSYTDCKQDSAPNLSLNLINNR